jgi:hypothetical protein
MLPQPLLGVGVKQRDALQGLEVRHGLVPVHGPPRAFASGHQHLDVVPAPADRADDVDHRYLLAPERPQCTGGQQKGAGMMCSPSYLSL